MDLLFDINSLAVLDVLGYKYFCTREEWTPHDGEQSSIYWQLVPFTTQDEALEYYFDCNKVGQRCHVFIEDEVIKELASGIPGLIIHIKAAETVLS